MIVICVCGEPNNVPLDPWPSTMAATCTNCQQPLAEYVIEQAEQNAQIVLAIVMRMFDNKHWTDTELRALINRSGMQV